MFLVYELAGLPHFTAAPRQINGFSVLGGFHPELGATGGTQVEEISPDWLFQGDNEIRFFPADEQDPVGYRVRKVRIVSVPEAREGDGTVSPVPAGDRARLSDHDSTTGVAARPGEIGLLLPLAPGEQPAAVSLHVSMPMTGALLAGTLGSDKKVRAWRELASSGLKPGWHTLPLDGLPAGAGVQLKWTPGRDGMGLLSEVRLATSPAPYGQGQRMTVATPLHGECVDHQAYLRGFVSPMAGGNSPGSLFVGDQEIRGGIAADGAFAVLIDEPARGKPWTVPLKVRFPDGDEVRRTVAIDICADRPLLVRAPPGSGPRPLIEDENAPFAKVVTPQGGAIELGGVLLHIPPGAVPADTRITARPLNNGELAPMENLMTNVTGDARGYRLGPHNLQFKKPIRITLPYARSRVSAEDDLGVFDYDDQEQVWSRVALAGRPARGSLTAETTHFTDFIAATIAQPDHPSAASFSAQTRSDLKVGDPTTGMTLIQPPSASNDGAAHLSYHIDVPPGRHGMGPNLNLTYNSNGGNGALGVGWDIPFSKIEVDTKFGTPHYDPATESERYLLDGEELVPVLQAGESASSPLPRRDVREFRFRSEGKFLRIKRVFINSGYQPNPLYDTYWTVQDRNGTVTFYGANASDNFYTIYGDHGTAVWGISGAFDTFGNTVFYECVNGGYQQLFYL